MSFEKDLTMSKVFLSAKNVRTMDYLQAIGKKKFEERKND